ncbi:MAG TPA: LysM peptidoglycan-binding domain-containing protein, partial [Candidatus Omnitrophica bacterium]|nr:LysM peptidoglycan-binding domain-containing protein [Candidatus Omnitrophota bacterium]
RGLSENRIFIVSRGKLDAVAPVTDLAGMQKDRNAQFMVAEVEEIMMPYPDKKEQAEKIGENKYLIEKEEHVESRPKVSTKKYTIEKGDSLWKIAEKEYGGGHRWKYIYELNKDTIEDPNNLREGSVILIPVE